MGTADNDKGVYDDVAGAAFADGTALPADDDKKSTAATARTSQATLTPTALPEGCSYGDLESERVIWVDFPPGSKHNPFYYPKRVKVCIVICTLIYTWFCSSTASAFAISAASMCKELGCSTIEAQAGIGLYAWGAGIMPLFIAPISEELGRRPVYLAAAVTFLLFHVANGAAQNTATVLVSRFMSGLSGSVGTSIVGGTLSDIFIPAQRGLPMLLSGFCLYFATGTAGTMFAYVDSRVGWRWVWWVHVIGLGACMPMFVFAMPETRSGLILRRRARKLRRERGMRDGARYLAHDEVDKEAFWVALKRSATRPLYFLATEPIVTFFSLWVALAWSVMYVQIAGLPYMMRNIYGFGLEGIGLMYLTTAVGSVFGFIGGKAQERLYRRMAPKKGVEARLYGPMVAGVFFALGCFITGATAASNVHWIGSAVGQVVMIAAIMTIYVTAFTYVSECYGTYASSAIAGQSSSRNMIGGGFAFATDAMFRSMTVRWAIIMMGGIAAVLALVPFVAFFYGPQIRARSPYSRALMQQEKDAIDAERIQREVLGMNMDGMEDYEGDANEKTVEEARVAEEARHAEHEGHAEHGKHHHHHHHRDHGDVRV